MTKGDWIRSMDDEKLVDFFGTIIDCWLCPMEQECNNGENCDNALLAWLKQEHEENSND